MNGAAARWAEPGDLVIFISYALMEDKEARDYQYKTIYLDEKNKIIKIV
jgi:aspartate 1-decarboxylase